MHRYFVSDLRYHILSLTAVPLLGVRGFGSCLLLEMTTAL
jgi:hypothetical protein